MFVSPTCRLEIDPSPLGDQSVLFTMGSSLQCWLYLARPAFPWVLRFQALILMFAHRALAWSDTEGHPEMKEALKPINSYSLFVCFISADLLLTRTGWIKTLFLQKLVWTASDHVGFSSASSPEMAASWCCEELCVLLCSLNLAFLRKLLPNIVIHSVQRHLEWRALGEKMV